MTYDWPLYAALFLALWSAVVGGVFSAFSEFIMSALLKSEAPTGIEAMQRINRDVIRTQFVAGILLIPALSLPFALYGLAAFEGIARMALIGASLVCVSSVLLMTMLGNVPLNNRLDSLDHTSPEARAYWPEYGRKWTRLNHVRAVGSVVTAILYTVAAISMITSGLA